MYRDRATNLRKNPIKARFNAKEYEALLAIADLNEREPAVFVREIVLAYLEYGSTENANANNDLQGPHEGLRRLCA